MKMDCVLAMEPGRELNELIAEKIMGWKRGNIKAGDLPWYPPKEISEFPRMGTPDYSCDISAAWEVLEHIKNKGAEINVGFFARWDCSIDYPIGCNWRAEAETAPEAICKAALLAILPGEE